MRRVLTLRHQFKSTGALLLLAFYLLVAVGVDFSKYFLHDHTAQEIHTYEAEADPCHRFVFHNDLESACDHETHISVPVKCSTIHIAFQGNQIVSGPAAITITAGNETPIFFYYTEVYFSETRTCAQRGPPGV